MATNMIDELRPLTVCELMQMQHRLCIQVVRWRLDAEGPATVMGKSDRRMDAVLATGRR